jgi:galactonate dehydratase
MTRVENAERMKAAMAAGYRAFLVRMPVEELRKAAGEGVDFVVEGSGGLAAAADVCRRLEKFHPYWFDEPCPATNLPAAKRLASESVTPLGFGRGLDEPAQFEDLLREEAVDVLRPALDRHGISGIRKLAAMAETRYAVVAPYHDGGPVGSAAALHLAASLPNFFIQQVPFPAAEADRAMRAALGGGEQPVEGFLPLPEGAGLGVAPDEATLARLAGAGGG